MAIKFPYLNFGELQVNIINKTLDLKLDVGDVIFAPQAQSHAFRTHEKEFPICIQFVEQVLKNPLYLGDDFRNYGKIELIAVIPAIKAGVTECTMT